MKNNKNEDEQKLVESLTNIKTVEDLYAKFFPNAYDRKQEEKSFRSYEPPQPVKASIL